MTMEERSEPRDTTPATNGPTAEGVSSPAGEGLPEDDLAGLTIDELKQKVREAREEAREARDEAQRNWQHFLHSAADLENYKKQAARDRQEAVERARRQMLGLVLSVLDNLERALAFAGDESSTQALLDGLRMAYRQILDQLKTIGVRPMEAVGQPFDPRLHEAVEVVEPEEAGQASGTIVSEVLKGYLINEDVLRPAKVKVVAERAADKRAGKEGGDPV